MYRFSPQNALEIFLVHPGGPYWKNKDAGSWVIPRGAVESDEALLPAAIREFTEETGLTPREPLNSLGEVRHKSGKIVHAWAFYGDCDPATVHSNLFEMEWPPKSGKLQRFPEIDRAAFFSIPHARQKILPAEEPFIDRIVDSLAIAEEATEAKTLSQATLGL